MEKKINKKMISGYIMATVGFLILVVHAIAYLFHLNFKAPALTIMGLVFVAIGMGIVRKSRK